MALIKALLYSWRTIFMLGIPGKPAEAFTSRLGELKPKVIWTTVV